MFDSVFDRLRGVHDKWARALLASIAILTPVLMVMTTVATLDNWRQDDERDDLLACFDQYAGRTSDSSKLVRTASVSVSLANDEQTRALRDYSREFARLMGGIVKDKIDGPEDLEPVQRESRRVAHTTNALLKANRNLADVRADNPIPEPPSEFCAVKP